MFKNATPSFSQYTPFLYPTKGPSICNLYSIIKKLCIELLYIPYCKKKLLL